VLIEYSVALAARGSFWRTFVEMGALAMMPRDAAWQGG
jgi:hypothetical protein